MEPLSLKTRRVYSIISFILLITILPIATLYASGYRLDGLSLASTGGIFIATPFSDISISLNGEERKRSSIFSKSFLIDNLKAGVYVVQTSASGYYPWAKNITVLNGVVTDVSALAVRYPLVIREIVSAGEETLVPTETPLKTVSINTYKDITDAFLSTTTLPVASSLVEEVQEPDSVQGGMDLFVVEGNLVIKWRRSEVSVPSHFCLRPEECAYQFSIEDWGDTVTRAEFFGGGIIFKTAESGIFFTDADVRPPRFIIPVYTKPESDFRIVNGMLVIEEGGSLYEVVGF